MDELEQAPVPSNRKEERRSAADVLIGGCRPAMW
jgi:hypothetical protein